MIGYLELDTDLPDGGRLGSLHGWADVGNLHVVEGHRGSAVEEWLFGQGARWLRLARMDRLLAYAAPEEAERLDLLHRLGFQELSRTARGWTHRVRRV